jgi:hypothetical protein
LQNRLFRIFDCAYGYVVKGGAFINEVVPDKKIMTRMLQQLLRETLEILQKSLRALVKN